MVDIHVQVVMYRGEVDTLSGTGRVRSIHGRYPCTGGDVQGKGDTLTGIGRVRSIHGGYPCTGDMFKCRYV